MLRDNRDPQEIGMAIDAARKANPGARITEIVDECPAPGIAHRLYGESEEQFRSRLNAVDPFRKNGTNQLAA